MLSVECSICSEILNDKCEISATHCGHLYHMKCIQNWMDIRANCPQCRKTCSLVQTFRIYIQSDELSCTTNKTETKLKDELKVAENKICALKLDRKDFQERIEGEMSCLNFKICELIAVHKENEIMHTKKFMELQKDFEDVVQSLEERIANLEEENEISKMCLKSLNIN